MQQQKFQELIERYISEQATADDIEKLKELLNEPEYVMQLETYMDSQLAASTATAADYPVVVDRLKTLVEDEIGNKKDRAKTIRLQSVLQWTAAAAIIVLCVTLGLNLFSKKAEGPIANTGIVSAPLPEKIVPGKDGAILTLADGRTIVLDSAGNGVVATENGSEIVLNNGQLIYKSKNANNISFNTMSTPNGRQFQLVLPDGTKAWLNAASSLRYPTAFVGADRQVEVTGEVYFEVAKNREKPFKVKVNEEMEVVVLGTHFNINAYANETSINTTLLEGAVQIRNGNQKELLSPGEQAQVAGNKKIKRIKGVNLKKVMAWKNGVFDFNGASLQEVLRQLERWYDITVVYEKGVPQTEFVGTMGRDLNLEDVLKGLKLSEVNFRMEGRKLIVLP
ncbi:MAG TPA: FecR domain-containing protein [Flavisolibacter sp.]|nr:FecR domain-containing protein [Flavisolibacter sp.]